jgi:hypothetical protein
MYTVDPIQLYLDIGIKNIVLYRIEFMPAIHRPTQIILGGRGF